MSTLHKVLVIGGTGLTGVEIVRALVEDGGFDITCLIRPSSANKPNVLALKPKAIKTILVDLENSTVPTIAAALQGYDTILSAIGFQSKQTELRLVDAIAQTNVSRFVPCSWATPCPPGDIMKLRDDKEAVFRRTWAHKIPYTVIDVGYWYQISLPRVPSGKLDPALLLSSNERFGDGDVENLLIDKRDIGTFVARILRDEQTLNRFVVCWGDRLSQTDVFRIVEDLSGETLEIVETSLEALARRRSDARAAFEEHPEDIMNRIAQSSADYAYSKYARGDNTLQNARYLGYLDARELYPDIKPTTFAEFVQQALDGKTKKVDLGHIIHSGPDAGS